MCNADGSDKFKLQIIGHSKRPVAFKIRDIHSSDLPCDGKSNGRAWYTTELTVVYVKAFDKHVTIHDPNREVLLLLDNFSAHVCAFETLQQDIIGELEVGLQPLDHTHN